MENAIFRNKVPVPRKLRAFGFLEENGKYVYRAPVCEGEFLLCVSVTAEGAVSAELTDTLTEEPYILHLLPEANGAFVGKVRAEYDAALSRIAETCFERNAFPGASAQSAIEYVRRRYGDEPEHLWEKFPDDAVWRRKDNRKWYGALLTVKGSRLGLDTDETLEIIDLRVEEGLLPSLLDGKRFFAGYHMNKKHWVTVLLDGSVPSATLNRLIDASYSLAAKKERRSVWLTEE